jgi:hypothetical protein
MYVAAVALVLSLGWEISYFQTAWSEIRIQVDLGQKAKA